MQGKPERLLAATKHHHTQIWKTCVCVCVQSNITYKNAGFQWSPTHIIELQERSSRMLHTTSFHYFLLLYMYLELLLAMWSILDETAPLITNISNTVGRDKIKLLITWFTLIFGPVFFPFIIQNVYLYIFHFWSSKSVCLISAQSESLAFHSLFLGNQTLLSSLLVMGSLKRKKETVMSTIQNQTVLFVPHIDLCVKASNTLARPLKHNFKHHKLVYVSSRCCRPVGVHPESCSLVKDFKIQWSLESQWWRRKRSVSEGCSLTYTLWQLKTASRGQEKL